MEEKVVGVANSVDFTTKYAKWYMADIHTLHKVPTPSSLAILAKALKTLVYPRRSSTGNLYDNENDRYHALPKNSLPKMSRKVFPSCQDNGAGLLVDLDIP